LSNQKTLPGILQGELVKTLYYLANSARIHQDNNQLIRECLTRFINALADFEGQETVDIQIWRGRFHIQGQRVLYNRESFHLLNEMVHYFSERGLGGICFLSSFRGTSPENILAFIRILNESASYEDPVEWLDQQLDKDSLSGVQVLKKQEEGLKNLDMKLKEKAWHTYFNALKSVKEVAEQASKGIAGVRKARRLAQAIVDLVEKDNSLMVGLATIKDYDDYTYTHSLNVALLATCLGRHLGLSKILLEHLTVCGMFHDLGKVEISKEILLKPGVLNPDECDMMRRHPLIGVRKILNLQAPQSMRSKIVRAPLEHHLNPDLSGYPKTRFIKSLSLLGKILHIADVYEALTSNRRYRPRAFTHNEALRRMWSERGKIFDAILLKYFIHMVGIYPIGSVVELDSGEIGLVLDYPDESDRALPLLAFLVDDGKGGITRGETVNLAAQKQDQGSTHRSIVRSIPSSHLGIQPAKLILQDTGAFGCL
jgi:HD-GYP domain-containing protein (c-di-GMP phosphodiesterase class II)